MNNNFDDFVQREQAAKSSNQTQVDWHAEKEVWLRYLEQLFANVDSFLQPYQETRQIAIMYRPINLNEEYIGLYSARQMLITIGNKVITLVPIGTLLLGAKGRVDVVGPFARGQLLLIDSGVKALSQLIRVSVSVGGEPSGPATASRRTDIEWSWKIVSRPPERKITELNKENFLNLLMAVSNG